MYHSSKNDNLSSGLPFSQEKHLFLQGGNALGDSRLVLSADVKPRLKWTRELHERFIEAVNQLGGSEKATPKTVMRLMGIPGLTLYHLKSHLQKYRLNKTSQAQSNVEPTNTGSATLVDRRPEGNGLPISNMNMRSQTNKTMQVSDALMMQIEVQRQLNEQLEVQKHLQLRIEAQGKYLQSVLEKAEETLGKKNFNNMDLEATKVELSELASIVANKCSQAGFQCLKEMSGLHKPQVQTIHVNDGSTGSCLTSCEEALKEPDMHKTCIGLRTYHSDSSLQSHQRSGVLKYEQIQASGMEDLKKNKMNISSLFTEIDEPTKGDPPIFSMNSRTQEPKISCHIAYDHRKGADSKYPHFEHPYNRTYDRKSALQDKGKQPIEYGFSSLTPNLDLNMQVFGEDSEGNKQFDLNGFV